MTARSAPRHKNGWHIALAVLLILLGLFILGHTVVATRVSVLTIGWSVLLAGTVALLAAVTRIGHRPFWFSALSGASLTSLGLIVLRYPDAADRSLTLIAAAVLLAGGILRMITASDDRRSRALLIVTGLASVLLGLFALSDIDAATANLLGRIVGTQIALDGISLLLLGRPRAGLRDRRHAGIRLTASELDAAGPQASDIAPA